MPKILYVGFGSSSSMISGAISYQNSLLEAISRQGWQVSHLFTIPRYTVTDKPYLRKTSRQGIKFIELLNSSIVPFSRGNPYEQCRQTEIEILFDKILDEEKPSLVHFHELLMLPVSLIDMVTARNIPAVKTMHNYYDICPQRNLMYQGNSKCDDSGDGKHCAVCLAYLPPTRVSFRRRLLRSALPDCLYAIFSNLYQLGKRVTGRPERRDDSADGSNASVWTLEASSNRRAFFVARLNKLDVVHCSSHRLAEIFINCGVLREKIRIITLSSRSLEGILPKPARDGGYPVVFGFVGGQHLHKGYRILLEAFSHLDSKRARLIIWGADRRNRFKGLNIEIRRFYRQGEINRVLKKIDVGVVPSIWEEAFGIIGLEFLAAGIPVIGSNIGGTTEWLKDGKNGFLVKPNDPEALAEKMGLLVENPRLISRLQQGIVPWKSFDEHVVEMCRLYEEVIAQRSKQYA